MEGYPLVSGGLEYLFGASTLTGEAGKFAFNDWWAHDRDAAEGLHSAFEGASWTGFTTVGRKTLGCTFIIMPLYYEVSALRRLSTRHDTRQDQVDELLRHDVFIDLYQIVGHGLRIGERQLFDQEGRAPLPPQTRHGCCHCR